MSFTPPVTQPQQQNLYEQGSSPIFDGNYPSSARGGGGGGGAISSITGSKVNGGSITINFQAGVALDKASKTAAPYIFWDGGDNSDLQSPLSRSNFDITAWTNCSRDLTVQLSGSAAKMAIPNNLNAGAVNPFFTGYSMNVGAGEGLSMFYKRRTNFSEAMAESNQGASLPKYNIKNYRAWGSAVGGQNNLHYGQSGYYSSAGVGFESFGSAASWSVTQFGDADHTLPYNRWQVEWIRILNSSAPGVIDGRTLMIHDDTLYDSGLRATYSDAQEPMKRPIMTQVQTIYTGASDDWAFWWDYIYIDDSINAIVLSDQSTWGAANAKYELVIPTAWADGQVVGIIRQGEISNLAAAYVYIIGDDGLPIDTNGFLLGS